VGNNPIGNVDPFGLAYGDWWDPRTYGLGGPSGSQTLPNGDLYMPPAPLPDPNTFGALHGIDLSITGGQPPGDFIADRAMDVAKDSALAMSMFAGLGEEEGAAEASGGLWKWLKGLGKKPQCETKTPFWSSTKAKKAVENAFGHWKKHGGEFPEFQNAKQYVEAAQRFVSEPPVGTLTRLRDGDMLLYDPASNTFAVRAASGAPRTMFRPTDGINYWTKQ
jgi:hypothetical protein